MKHLQIIMTLLTMLFLSTACQKSSPNHFNIDKQEDDIRFCTFNIRYDSPHDSINSWPNRLDWVSQFIKEKELDFVGTQEGQPHQIQQMQEKLPHYTHFGKGRDGGESGESTAIFYHKEKFKLLEQGTFWLSETPEQVGKGWDADYNRICTWGKFENLSNNQIFFLFNTHFDHRGEIARRESAKLILEKTHEIAKNEKIILMGDFNAKVTDEPIILLENGSGEMKFFNSRQMTDKVYGPNLSFQGWGTFEKEGNVIDHIFVNDSSLKVSQYWIAEERNVDRFISDHYPVVIDIQIP